MLPIDDRILLVEHTKGGETYHLLPGGGIEPGESVGEALAREVHEETGLLCRIVRPLFVSDTIAPGGGRHIVNLIFLAEIVGGELTRAQDPRVTGVRLATPDELPSVDLRPPMADAIMEAAREAYSSPARYLGPLWT